ncbi:formylglycine-generating enzyme family protein [Rhizobium sp. FKL33]|uniref:SUMF1/EgtB/PvdO family nonheme iron enzyme n=1 Tax=Rhizobium sp. FKL33 TaxID=2562307 RepID=UPI0010C14007|nr:formylglycine-generating enzyme family protein [Rhizobium sp. FKL33]
MTGQTFITKTVSLFSVAAPAALLLAFSLGVAHQLGVGNGKASVNPAIAPVTVTIPDHAFRYRADGEFYRNGFAVDPPMVSKDGLGPIAVMKYQVSEVDYRRCVQAQACPATAIADHHGEVFPVTGVSFDDASAYARWLSRETGEVWRLPSHEEIAYAAGDRFPDDALGVDEDSDNPALRWLADYDRETARKAASDPKPRERGHYGENLYGLADFAGNVWEWTTTCHRRVDLAGDWTASAVSSCGVYVTVGQHRSPMSAFVRDPKTGGCSVGAPPANLGFRLIRDDRWYAKALMRLRERGLIS